MTKENYTFSPNLYKMDLSSLCEFGDAFFAERGYFVPEGQGETKAQQLCTCVCKILHRYWNDWDEYNKGYWRETCWYAARWIKNHCFKWKISKTSYRTTLRNLLIETLIHIDKYSDSPVEWDIYKA